MTRSLLFANWISCWLALLILCLPVAVWAATPLTDPPRQPIDVILPTQSVPDDIPIAPTEGADAIAPTATPEATPVPEQKPDATYETQYLKKLIDFHSVGARLAALGYQQSVNRDIQAFSLSFEARQLAENEMMQEMLENWYKVQYTPQSTPESDKELARLAPLRGREFDKALVRLMLDFNEKETDLAREALRHNLHDDLKLLVAEVMSINRDELRRMAAWLRAADEMGKARSHP